MAAEQLITKLGRSLPVPIVQELAKEAATTVSGRYVRPKQDIPIISDPDSDLAQVPVIDMERLLTQEFMELELHKLNQACKEWGFSQIVNHGMSIELIKEMKVEIQEFFNLPMEEKKKYWQKEGDLQGFGQVLFNPKIKRSIGSGREGNKSRSLNLMRLISDYKQYG